ncbi:hypothetical protein J2787_001564 [Chryseobacterium rhizosphaerae]|uniref:Uncharacterized protein n=1 Tax=Chryseobacterium rhizosphaerae TaxID=395937 RepID=A0AAE3Y725_9FLAO|nr:hypothetical protein [Chryseobacterium rhizosphaerae]MDR6526194.1 hypothetical protein [Chryseobacterium rhizosphaerae]
MEYYLEVRFLDRNYNASVHFATTFPTSTEANADQFFNELISALERRKVDILTSSYFRIDNDPKLKIQTLESHESYLKRSTAHIQIDRYDIEDPDQNMSVTENLLQKFYADKKPIAEYTGTVNTPVIVRDKQRGDDIRNDFYYFTLEHLSPINSN